MNCMISNYWPIYSGFDKGVMLDDKVANALSKTFGSYEMVLYILDRSAMFERAMNGNSIREYADARFSVNGVQGLMVGLAWLNAGKAPNITGMDIGMALADILCRIDRMDLLKALMDENLTNGKNAGPCPGIAVAVAGMIVGNTVPSYISERFFRFVQEPMVCKGNARQFQKTGVMRSVIAEMRRAYPERRMDKIEYSCLTHEENSQQYGVKDHVMWMLSDPYRRMKSSEFNWDSIPKTRDAIMEVFPFALPDRYDVDRRSRHEILKGLLKILSWPKDRSVMDTCVVKVVLTVFSRLMDMGPADNSEIDSDIGLKILSYTTFLMNCDDYVDRVIDRIPRKSPEDVVLYAAKDSEENISKVAMHLFRRDVLESLSIIPVTSYKN